MQFKISFTATAPAEDEADLRQLDDISLAKAIELTIIGLGIVPPADTVSDFDVEVIR